MSSIAVDGARVFLQTSFFQTSTVVGSPAAAAETVIASVTLPTQIRADQTVYLFGFAGITVGTNGTAATLRLRRTSVGGTIVASSGALTVVAANLVAPSLLAPDVPGAVANQVYVLTLQVTAASATSTVTPVALYALVI